MKTEISFGERVMFIRKQQKLSQESLGKRIGTSGDVIGRYERGDIMPSILVAIKIADILKISLDYLVGRSWFSPDKSMQQRLQHISELDKEDHKTVLQVLDMTLLGFQVKKLGVESNTLE